MTPQHPAQPMLRTAMALLQAGRARESIEAYERILSRWPRLPDAWYNLAYQLRLVGRYQDALAAYQEALNHGIDRPEEILTNRSAIYSENLRRDDAAEMELRKALRRKPDYIPALLNLGALKENSGDRDEARAFYHRILTLVPSHPEALARYAGTQKTWKRGDPFIERLRQGVGSPHISPTQRAGLLFALGQALDAIGAFDEAFDKYRAANRESHAEARAAGVRYDRKTQETLIDDIIASFPKRENISRTDGEPAPIFICGMFRSGSTLAEQVLAAHPHVTAGGELDIIPALVHRELAPFPASMANILPAQIDRLAQTYLARSNNLFPGADVLTDKRPDNFLYIGLIKTMFPNARIVNTNRHALDNCLSIFFLHLGHSFAYGFDLMDIGHYYRQYRRLMDHWHSLYPGDIFDFEYDKFVVAPRTQTEALLKYCGLHWDEACMAFHEKAGDVRTASSWQVREPLHTRSSGRWKNYDKHLAELREYLASQLR